MRSENYIDKVAIRLLLRVLLLAYYWHYMLYLLMKRYGCCRLAREGVHLYVPRLCSECFNVVIDTWLDLFSASGALANSLIAADL